MRPRAILLLKNMAKLEEEARKIRRMGMVQQAILATVAISGIIAVGLVAPKALEILGRVPAVRRQFMYRSGNILSDMAKEGYVTFEEKKGARFARITPEGKAALMRRGSLMFNALQRPRRWDKRWRVIIFDIPEYRRVTRDALRKMMQSFGFYRLQDSVWVYPYDCEDVVALAKAELKIGASVLYMVVEKIENDQRLKEEFLLR